MERGTHRGPGGGLWTSRLARSGSGPAHSGEAGAPRGGPLSSPCSQRCPPSLGPGATGGVHTRGASWLRGGQGRPPGLPLSQEPAAAAPTGHGVVSKVNHADAPPAALGPGPRPLALVPTHTRFSGSLSRAPSGQPSSSGWMTCSRGTCHCPSACLPGYQSRSRRGPPGCSPEPGHPRSPPEPSPSCLGPVTMGHTAPQALSPLKSQQDMSIGDTELQGGGAETGDPWGL